MKTWLTALYLLVALTAYSQVRINSAVISIDSSYLILRDSTQAAITKVSQAGGVLTKNADAYVNIRATGNQQTYVIPFVASNSDSVPVKFEITSPTSGSSISFNSFEVDDDNSPLPTASYVDGLPVDLYRYGIDRFWKIVPQGFVNSFPQSRVTFMYSNLDLVGNSITEDGLQVKRFNDVLNTWDDVSYSALPNNQRVTVNLSSSSDFYKVWTLYYSASLLPIELISFSTKCSEGITVVEWKTAAEIDVDYFSIETSRDAVSWTQVAKVSPLGQLVNSYSTQVNSSGYFRLVTVDLDGTREISSITHARCKAEALSWSIANGTIRFNTNVDKLIVYNLLGQLIDYRTTVNSTSLPEIDQVYIVIAEIDGETFSFKIAQCK